MVYCIEVLDMSVAIVLFSGGLDSSACLYWALEKYDKIILLSFTYGSKEDEVIQKTNLRFKKLYEVESKIIYLDFLEEFTSKRGSKLSSSRDEPPIFSNQKQLDDKNITIETARQVWVPGRNILFLSIAASFADSFAEPVQIIFGANEEEGTTFPDNTPEFVRDVNRAIGRGCLNKVEILAPFSSQNKKDILEFLIREDAAFRYMSSCYHIKGWTEQNQPIHCGVCESCQRKQRAFREVKYTDPTVYSNK